ncbi:MAG: hypothetical protein ACFFBP_01400 [Promethearchaeota archaeon]
MSLWMVIAKNEIKRGTSRFRGHRMLFFVIVYALLIFWAFILIPFLFNLFIPAYFAIIPGINLAIGTGIEYLMMIIFLMFMMYPLNNVFRKTEIGFKEILLASPATAGDIFLGEFLGKFFIYSVGILIFSPIVVGLVGSLTRLTIIEYAIIYCCIAGHIMLATLFGNILASLLEHKIAKNPKFRDLGKVFMFIIAIAMVVIIYSVTFFFDYIYKNPQLKNWLMLYPSLWFSNIILFIINPELIMYYFLSIIWSNVLLVIFVPLLIFYIAYKKADSFFTLEGGIEKMTTIVEKEFFFYTFIRKIFPNKWETLVVSQLKEFFRKKENIMKMVYDVGIICFMGLIYSITYPGAFDTISKQLFSVIVILMSGVMYSIMIGNYIFVGSKDLLWVYKRSPRGVKTLIFSYILAMLIPNLIIDVVFTIYFAIIYQYTLFMIIFFFIAYLINCLIMLIQVSGVQSLNPSFEEKGKEMGINIIIQMIVNLGLIFLSFFFFDFFISLAPTEELISVFFIIPIFLISISFSIPLMYLGIRKLSRIE